MPKLRKIICSTLMATLTALSFKTSAKVITTPENKLTVYAGPQSVVPLEIISVTVEAVNAQGGSLDNYPVTLSYNADGVAIMISGKTINGLVSFDVPAQTRAVCIITERDRIIIKTAALRIYRFNRNRNYFQRHNRLRAGIDSQFVFWRSNHLRRCLKT